MALELSGADTEQVGETMRVGRRRAEAGPARGCADADEERGERKASDGE